MLLSSSPFPSSPWYTVDQAARRVSNGRLTYQYGGGYLHNGDGISITRFEDAHTGENYAYGFDGQYNYLMRMQTAEITAVCDLVRARTEACMRLFGAKSAYTDYCEMLEKAELDAVFILTAPGTHVPFTLKALAMGKHVLLQKPMATNMDDARTIAAAVRVAGVKCIIEPSSNSPLDPDVAQLRQLVRAGVLGDILWFSLGVTGPTTYGPALGMNPYGQAAFYAEDSGGFLFDLPYAPANIVSVLGGCQSVMAYASISVGEHHIVPEAEYDKFLAAATDPDAANYWDVVVDLPRTQRVRMEAVDNAYSLYEMDGGVVGACHVGRIYHPVLPGSGGGSLQIFGTEGNLIFGAGYSASIISTLPRPVGGACSRRRSVSTSIPAASTTLVTWSSRHP